MLYTKRGNVMRPINEEKVIHNLGQLGDNYGLVVLAKLSNKEQEQRIILSELEHYNQHMIKQSLELLVENQFLQVRIEEIMPPNIYYKLTEQGALLIPVLEQIEALNI